MKIDAIHQFHPSCAFGDGVTNGMLYTRRLLRSLGFKSEIYCDHISPEMKKEIKPSAVFCDEPGQMLFVHHSLGYENEEWLSELRVPKVLVYHNITPEELLPVAGPWRRLSRLGREQLGRWKEWLVGAIGDSELNSSELREYGYASPVTLPLLVDCEHILSIPWDAQVATERMDTLNILFVGRISENKRQDLLLEVFAEFCHFTVEPSRLILVGGVTSPAYADHLHARVAELGIGTAVEITGKISNEALYGYYRAADLFVCMSEHEGFGMPLIEAMLFDVPVVAYAAGNVPDTLGEGGLLLDSRNPAEIAALLYLASTEPGLRRRIIAGQRANLRRFLFSKVRAQLAGYLRTLGVCPAAAVSEEELPSKPYWRIEGPFDSNYSLAIVNRKLAEALEEQGYDVGLHSTEGGGDYPPDPAFLAAYPQLARMNERAGKLDDPDVTLRFCYPPRTDGLRGVVRAVHSYGWEESAFPACYVDWFNRKLDLVTVLSPFVEKILRDSGVRVPIAVTGGGADHMLHLPDCALDVPLDGKRFRFLHVSSCFPRKGVDVLLAAYGKAFGALDDVVLVIKTFRNPHNDVARQLKQLRAQDADYPEVVLLEEDFSEARLAALYRACDAFVLPSRGEGLGLPAAEAMLFGLPVITTAWGGQSSFCTPETTWLCDYQFVPAESHLAVESSVWAEPDMDDLVRLMRDVYRADKGTILARTRAAREQVLASFTWAQVAKKTIRAVEALESMPMLRKEPIIGWVTTWNIRCGIAAYSRNLPATFPADRLVVLANRISDRIGEDGSNVVRCWNMHNDERLDDLYNEIQTRGISVLVIQYNFGFFSLPALAGVIDRLKSAGVAVHCFFHATADVVRGTECRSLSSIADSLRNAARLYVHSLGDLNRLKGFGLVDNVVYFPHGVYQPHPVDAAALKSARGLAGKRIVASYGFLLPHKGLQALIHAVFLLDEVHLLLVNALYPVPDSVSEKQACENIIEELGLRDRVTFVTDFLSDDESLRWLQMADLVVYPYQQTQESSSAAVRMGIASGRPVAITPLPIFDDVREVVHVLPGFGSEQLATGIGELLNDSASLASKLEHTEEWLEARRWPLLSKRLLNIIDGLANPLWENSP